MDCTTSYKDRVFKVLKYLYDGSELHLDRKYEKFLLACEYMNYEPKIA